MLQLYGKWTPYISLENLIFTRMFVKPRIHPVIIPRLNSYHKKTALNSLYGKIHSLIIKLLKNDSKSISFEENLNMTIISTGERESRTEFAELLLLLSDKLPGSFSILSY